MSIKPSNQTYKSAPIWRRFAALIYDSFINFSFIVLITAIALIMNHGQSFLPFRYFFLIYLILTMGFFLAWFWHRGGQTLGMVPWKIKIVDKDYQRLTWTRAWLRYGLSLLSMGLGGIGLLWCFIDKESQSLHDRLAGSRIIMGPSQ